MKFHLCSPAGEFSFSPEDGALIRASPFGNREISPLLEEAEPARYPSPRRWGKGFVITSLGAARWHRPENPEPPDPGHLQYRLSRAGLALRVTRSFGDSGLEERFDLLNISGESLRIGCVGVSLPIRDIYPSAAECLKSCFHAHGWTGGSDSWVWSEPMSGSGPGMGLDLLEGELWSYSVENRDHVSGSNSRGHLYLHPTDHFRNPDAFGGQPEYRIAPGGSLRWRWRLAWFADFAAFEKSRHPRNFSPGRLAAHVGETLTIEAPECRVLMADDVRIAQRHPDKVTLKSEGSGIRWIETGTKDAPRRAAILFHHRIEEIVQRRVNYILAHQQAGTGEPTREGAFLCFDARVRMMEIGDRWGDWSDGRERLAMPILVQEAIHRGWANPQAAEAVERFRQFATASLITDDHEVVGASDDFSTARLYNYPWMSEFFRNEYRRSGRLEDLKMSADILDAYYARGGRKFLGFLYGIGDLIETLRAAGEEERAENFRTHLLAQAREFVGMGVHLPSHEVNYEQSIVAPLALLLITAQKLLPGEDWSDPIRKVLTWLRAFEGCQPDARLYGVPIRHWDGFWFGRNRQWGDVFPHYWSVLSAAAYLEAAGLYPDLKDELEARANRIFRANLVHFQDDGFASCAFVYPSCVNGLPAHQFDPMANDQDWALVWLLRYLERLPELAGTNGVGA